MQSVMLEVLWSAASQKGYCTHLPCKQQSTAHAIIGRAMGCSTQTRSTVGNHIPLLNFLDAAFLSASCQKERALWNRLKQGRPSKPSFHLLNIFFSLQKSPEQILYWSTPSHLYWSRTSGHNDTSLFHRHCSYLNHSPGLDTVKYKVA